MKRIFRCMAAFMTVLLLCFSHITLKVFATPETHPNTYVNTGDQRADVIGVALTQVGYREGSNNDNKYGVWYGYNHIAWCGIFVAWCADQAGVPTTVLAKTGIANPASYGLTTEPLGYIPKPGDLFFTFDHTHVGFVYYVEGEYFYSLEGNTWEDGPEGVYIRKHRLDSKKYASPKYQGGGDHNYVLGNEVDHPHKEFYRCTDCADQYYTGKTANDSNCSICIQNNCDHKFGAYTSDSETSHSRVCALCGKTETNDHSWGADKITKEATCSYAGAKEQACAQCGDSRTVYLAATGVHSFSQWEFTDDNRHSRSCENCGVLETQQHNTGDRLLTDETMHWHDCSICEEKISAQEHAFEDTCDAPCKICDYVRPDGHRYRQEMVYDSKEHWVVCEVCGIIGNRADHEFSAQCDESCDLCGYTRETNHVFSDVYITDLESHWFACEICGSVAGRERHTPENGKRQGAVVCCTVCELVLTSDAMHTHGYDELYHDTQYHWGSCSCGIEMEQQQHQWSMKTELCSICAEPMPKQEISDLGFLPWMAGGVGLLLAGSILIVLLLKKEK